MDFDVNGETITWFIVGMLTLFVLVNFTTGGLYELGCCDFTDKRCENCTANGDDGTEGDVRYCNGQTVDDPATCLTYYCPESDTVCFPSIVDNETASCNCKTRQEIEQEFT